MSLSWGFSKKHKERVENLIKGDKSTRVLDEYMCAREENEGGEYEAVATQKFAKRGEKYVSWSLDNSPWK